MQTKSEVGGCPSVITVVAWPEPTCVPLRLLPEKWPEALAVRAEPTCTATETFLTGLLNPELRKVGK